MEEHWLFFYPAALTICIVVMTFFISSVLQAPSRQHKTASPPLPPGPPPLSVLSTVFALLRRSEFDVEVLLRRLHNRHGPVVSFRLLSSPRWPIFVSDRVLAHRALVKCGATFADRPLALDPGLIISSNRHNVTVAPYGPVWRALRRNLTAQVLHPSRHRVYSPVLRQVVDVLIKDLETKSSGGTAAVVVMDSLRIAVSRLLAFMCFGEWFDDEKIRRIASLQREVLTNFGSFGVFAVYPKITKLLFRSRWKKLLDIRRRQEEMYIPLINARRNLPLRPPRSEDDGLFVYSYVDSLVDLEIPEDGGRKLTDGEIISLCSEFLSAGTEMTVAALEWITANLVKQPDIQTKLYEEIERVVGKDAAVVREEDLQRMPYLKAVVLEGLRRHPPGHFLMPHTVTEEVEFEGYRIPKGAAVIFEVAEIGRDGAAWTEPMEFRPERFLEGAEGEGVDIMGGREIRMMPFGVGRRICPALALSLVQLKYFVANLAKEFEWKPATDGEEIDMTENFEFTVVMKMPFRARTVSRKRA